MKELGKFTGCLLGGASGDALGYAVEFKSLEEIQKKYGPEGITRFELSEGRALVSDDTQMTMFTADGILFGATREKTMGVMAPVSHYIHKAYKDWLKTQMPSYFKDEDIVSWIYYLKELNARRAPGNTCLYALSSGIMGTLEAPLNSSKGCGCVMRLAPVGLYYDKEAYGTERIDLIGAKAAAITHGHPLGFVSAAAFVHIINNIIYTDFDLDTVVRDCIETIKGSMETFPETDQLISLLEKAVKYAGRGIDDPEAIRRLGGGGWVGEEALAISVYCSLKYKDSFEKAIIAAVNHSGDSDSTGSMTGNIMGAYLGINAIPPYYLDRLELYNEIEELATDLYTGCPEGDLSDHESWIRKYVKCDRRASF
ncbi:MAG: ADP-ribosylglycohydrolase family protein [Bacillota bacterium]|nr:ADP-ribosylglycohydrolase family protein [Bacillota bacterium]